MWQMNLYFQSGNELGNDRGVEIERQDDQNSSTSNSREQNQNLASLYHGGWPIQHNGG